MLKLLLPLVTVAAMLLVSACEPAPDSTTNDTPAPSTAPKIPDKVSSGVVSAGVSYFRTNLAAYLSEGACLVAVTVDGAEVSNWVQSSGDVAPGLLRDVIELCTGARPSQVQDKVYSTENRGTVLWFTEEYMYPVDVELRQGGALIRVNTPKRVGESGS